MLGCKFYHFTITVVMKFCSIPLPAHIKLFFNMKKNQSIQHFCTTDTPLLELSYETKINFLGGVLTEIFAFKIHVTHE